MVTERFWSSMLSAAKVPERFGTTVTRSLQGVVEGFT